MTLFSWFTDNKRESHKLTLNGGSRDNMANSSKSMWPIAKVRYIPSSYIDKNLADKNQLLTSSEIDDLE